MHVTIVPGHESLISWQLKISTNLKLPNRLPFTRFLSQGFKYESRGFEYHVIDFKCFVKQIFSILMNKIYNKDTTSDTYISKLRYSKFSQLGDGLVSRLWLDEELAKRHLLASEHRPHLGRFFITVIQTRNKEWKLTVRF